MPILARGGGTALAGQACNAALVLDFSKYMNSIRSIDAERARRVVEPGVVQSQLNAAARASMDLFFAPDPSTKDRCTMGGMIGNNSCGAHSAAYGKTVDNLVALDVAALRRHAADASRGQQRRGEDRADVARGGRDGEIYSRLRRAARSPRRSDAQRAFRKFRAASPATTSTSCCPKRDSTWRARWSVRKGRWR